MAFSETEKANVRRYLGASRFHITSDPRLESAITTAESHAATETLIRDTLTALATVQTQLDECVAAAMALNDGDTRIDFGYRYQFAIHRGRMLVGVISDALEFQPYRDVWTAPKLGGGRMRDA
jgi:hypothetical protein